MSYYIEDDVCISCGACEFVCDTFAISRLDNFRGTFIIDPMLCYDCGVCPEVCPVDCIKLDSNSIICHGRGCPLNEKSALRDWECSELKARCSVCDNVLWRKPGTEAWTCFACEGGKGACPKVRAAQKPSYNVEVRLSARAGTS
jgi:NAD-dependent dihydropyrimidine dehydrogenase PreA subunit